MGAVVVMDGEIVGRAHNAPISLVDPTAHAEILALREAATKTGNYRLTGATLYATVEPCAMCCGARCTRGSPGWCTARASPRRARSSRCTGCWTIARLNHRVVAMGGVLADESAALLREFFDTATTLNDSRRGGRARLKASDSKSDRGPEGPSGVQILSPPPIHIVASAPSSRGGVTERPKVRHWKCRARVTPVPWVQIPPPPPSFESGSTAASRRLRRGRARRGVSGAL